MVELGRDRCEYEFDGGDFLQGKGIGFLTIPCKLVIGVQCIAPSPGKALVSVHGISIGRLKGGDSVTRGLAPDAKIESKIHSYLMEVELSLDFVRANSAQPLGIVAVNNANGSFF
jgi:hypothetical protein